MPLQIYWGDRIAFVRGSRRSSGTPRRWPRPLVRDRPVLCRWVLPRSRPSERGYLFKNFEGTPIPYQKSWEYARNFRYLTKNLGNTRGTPDTSPKISGRSDSVRAGTSPEFRYAETVAPAARRGGPVLCRWGLPPRSRPSERGYLFKNLGGIPMPPQKLG